MLQPLVSVRIDGETVTWEWPSWSRDGVRELRGEFELGYDSPQWDEVWEPLEWIR